MKTVYECDFCRTRFFRPEDRLEHEPLCYDNEATRSCETCLHHDTVCPEGGKIWNTCDKKLLTSASWEKNHRTQCPGWESQLRQAMEEE